MVAPALSARRQCGPRDPWYLAFRNVSETYWCQSRPRSALFDFLSSTTRRDDPVGTVLDRWNPEEIQELAPLETALAAEEGAQGETVPVRLHSNVNEVGTLELWCQSTRDPRRWKLEFNVREPSED